MNQKRIILSLLAALLLPVVTLAVTTIGPNITTDGDITVGGDITAGSLTVSGTISNGTTTLSGGMLNGVSYIGLGSNANLVFQVSDGFGFNFSDGSANTLLSISDAGTVGNVGITGDASVGGNLSVSGIIQGGNLTDGTLTISGGSISGVQNITASGTIQGATLTDGTISITGGKVDGVDVSEIESLKTSFFNSVANSGTTTVDEFYLQHDRTLRRIDFYSQTAYLDGDSGDGCWVEVYDQEEGAVRFSLQVPSGTHFVSGVGAPNLTLQGGHHFEVRIKIVDNDNTHTATSPVQGNITLHIQQK